MPDLPAPSRRSVAAGLAALLAAPGAIIPTASKAAAGDWPLATQVIAGTRVADPNFLELAVSALTKEAGADVVHRLYSAVLARDAASVVEPFEDDAVEKAARRFIEMIYTGEISQGATVGYHQALAWQVLPFTKPPSVCGPDMGWWTDPPEQTG